MLLKLSSLMCLGLTVVVASAAADNDQAFRGFLSSVAQKEAQAQAKKLTLTINQAGFQGQLTMPYPEKIQVDVASFELKNDIIKASVAVQGDIRITGVWTREGQSLPIKADVSAKLSVTGMARFEKQGADFFVAPTLTDCDFTLLKLAIQEPAELAEGDAFLTELANAAFQKNKANIINQINRSMTKHKIKF